MPAQRRRAFPRVTITEHEASRCRKSKLLLNKIAYNLSIAERGFARKVVLSLLYIVLLYALAKSIFSIHAPSCGTIRNPDVSCGKSGVRVASNTLRSRTHEQIYQVEITRRMGLDREVEERGTPVK